MSRCWDSFELGLEFEIAAMLGHARHRPRDVESLRHHLLQVRTERGCYVDVRDVDVPASNRNGASGNGKTLPPIDRDAPGRPIPVARLQPVLQRAVEQRYGGAVEVAIEDIAKRTGVPFRTVKGVLRGRGADVDFGTADALLAGASATVAWLDELADLYGVEHFAPTDAEIAA